MLVARKAPTILLGALESYDTPYSRLLTFILVIHLFFMPVSTYPPSAGEKHLPRHTYMHKHEAEEESKAYVLEPSPALALAAHALL